MGQQYDRRPVGEVREHLRAAATELYVARSTATSTSITTSVGGTSFGSSTRLLKCTQEKAAWASSTIDAQWARFASIVARSGGGERGLPSPLRVAAELLVGNTRGTQRRRERGAAS